MPLVYHWFPASDRREDNFIAGLSMGGGGALQYAVGHPEKIRRGGHPLLRPPGLQIPGPGAPGGGPCSPLCSAPETPSLTPEDWKRTWTPPPACGTSCRPLQSPAPLPRLYFCCGKEDFLYHRYEAFKAYAGEIGLQATFEEAPGYRHEWRFWDLFIQKALTFFGLDGEAQGNPF